MLKLQALLSDYYANRRRRGHTTAALLGVANVDNARLYAELAEKQDEINRLKGKMRQIHFFCEGE